jgi:hypothetical protein
MKPEMITLKHGDSTIKMPASHLAKLAMASVFAQVLPAANVPLPTPSAIPAIGSYWPGEGGVNAGLMRGEDGQRDYYLIVPDVKAKRLAYGGYEIESPGVASRRDGMANTKALIESDTDHPAAQWCAELEIDGHGDLCLPAISELALCMANVPELFEKEWHLSSTQRSAYNAFFMHFDDGSQTSSGKGDELRVRPVRRVFI